MLQRASGETGKKQHPGTKMYQIVQNKIKWHLYVRHLRRSHGLKCQTEPLTSSKGLKKEVRMRSVVVGQKNLQRKATGLYVSTRWRGQIFFTPSPRYSRCSSSIRLDELQNTTVLVSFFPSGFSTNTFHAFPCFISRHLVLLDLMTLI